jgi:hypothetical protein
MKSHTLFCRWALVMTLALLLLPATDALAADGDDGASFALSHNSRISRVSTDVDLVAPGEVGTTYGDPDDVGGGEGKDKDRPKPDPDWDTLSKGAASTSANAIAQLWQLLLESARHWLR